MSSAFHCGWWCLRSKSWLPVRHSFEHWFCSAPRAIFKRSSFLQKQFWSCLDSNNWIFFAVNMLELFVPSSLSKSILCGGAGRRAGFFLWDNVSKWCHRYSKLVDLRYVFYSKKIWGKHLGKIRFLSLHQWNLKKKSKTPVPTDRSQAIVDA